MQLDLFGDYKSNVALYPAFQEYFRTHKPRFLAAWGKNDPFFLPAGAEAFKRDMPEAVVRFFDTGHFALETHATEIAAAISVACVSSAKWPVSKKRTTASGMSRLNASAPAGRKNGSFLPHAARKRGLWVRKYS